MQISYIFTISMLFKLPDIKIRSFKCMFGGWKKVQRFINITQHGAHQEMPTQLQCYQFV